MGRVRELLINSEKASTFHLFDEYIGRFSRFQFSMIHTHDPESFESLIKVYIVTCTFTPIKLKI